MRASVRPAALLALFVLPAAFAGEAAPKPPAEVPAYNVNNYYQVHQDQRIYVFDDAKTFTGFLSSGDTPYRLTRIGAGPKGETLVFGLRGMDKDKQEENIGGGPQGRTVVYVFGKANKEKSPTRWSPASRAFSSADPSRPDSGGIRTAPGIFPDGIYACALASRCQSTILITEAPKSWTNSGASPAGHGGEKP